ncbi:hypothetical protein [Myxococcus fulvus]|uniref:hypothetical protein n=1 Tax=Myxococcus fulvus TaxID=33 RepID=UPI0020C158DF|nr:hypothetical protein [Myxococcus fulvus]MCK8502079.1 hypothetical protein [Myxococcus fulvus]
MENLLQDVRQGLGAARSDVLVLRQGLSLGPRAPRALAPGRRGGVRRVDPIISLRSE